MLRASRFFLLALVALSAHAFAQETDVPWLSLKRLSVMGSSSYHYSPWQKYNESLALAGDAFRYDPYYQNPRGTFEKVFGDASFDLTALYRLVPRLSVGIRAGLLTTGGTAAVSYNRATVTTVTVLPSDFIRSIEQNVRLDVPHYGIGLQYALSLSKTLELSASTYVSRYLGTFSFDYTDGTSVYTADLREGRFGLVSSVDILCTIYGPLSIASSFEYRWLKFPHLTGNGLYTQHAYTYTQAFEAQLGEADGYFGLLFKYVPNGPGIHALWERTPSVSWWITQKPAVLDISGVGLSLGVQYAF
jgi:hypothetical protein